ncbi:copper-containing nitrite reductase [Devosia sp. YIM 151766]|uniref:copper-containing nitrite reductase n=1 Tax=Devosia sp. YIM 151766 TaxID=3017325 RepID=UPI00255C96F1|nr:copper-containing nitrite reductase [Devosia sp. YIM 151766]WIY52360.1 copper-containing nitrite reductase [Devosia sp. YIM 151766]
MANNTMLSRRALLAGAAAIGATAQLTTMVAAGAQDVAEAIAPVAFDALERVKVDLVAPPFVHAHEQVASGAPKIVEFTMVIEEKVHQVDDNAEVWGMTFNGSIPGPLMVVHEGDYVELTLINPDTNLLLHNIDFHAATGALGGASLTDVNPGEKAVLRFKATKAGVFVYHCAPEGMVPWHVTAGMNGAIMVLPREGLRDPQGNLLTYDRVYYVGEQDFYIPKDADGNYRSYDSVGDGYADTLEVMRTLLPSHIVFNGRVGALTGDNALKANVGDKVLIVHSQANRDTRPHLIGGHGDFVWPTGKFHTPPDVDQETWFIPGGAAGAAFYTFLQPGVYAYVNHNLIEAFELGAAGHFVVEGDWNDDLMTSVLAPSPI